MPYYSLKVFTLSVCSSSYPNREGQSMQLLDCGLLYFSSSFAEILVTLFAA